MNNSFCALPWVSLATDTNGDIVPCCVSTQKIKKQDGSNFNLGTDSLIDIYNSQDFVNLRQAMIDGELVSGCQECYDNEKYGLSQRLQFNSKYNVESLSAMIDFNPKYLDVRPGNLCNLRCKSCSPTASSQFAKEIKALQYQGIEEFHEVNISTDNDWYTTNTFYDNIDTALETIEDIYLTGGEPSIMQSNIDMLTKLIDAGKSKDINITISTNLTNSNFKFFELLKHFKQVLVYASIDGFDGVQEYIRYPSSWKSVVANLEYVLTLANTQVVVTPVVQITNLNKLIDLFQFIETLNKRNEKIIYIYPINLETPDYLDIVNLPTEYKLKCSDKIDQWLDHYTYPVTREHFSFIKNKAKVNTDFKSQLKKFIRYNSLLDANRQVSLETANPELFEMLQEQMG